MKNRILLSLLIFLLSGFTVNAQSWLWGQQASGGLKAESYASNVATNKTGNVYQTGNYDNSISFGATTLTSAAEADMFLVKHDKNGNVLWARTTQSGYYSYASGYSVATDDSDNSFVVGFGQSLYYNNSPDTILFGSKQVVLPSGGYLFLAKYDPNGNVVWVTYPDSNVIYNGATGLCVTVDKSGYEYVTGSGGFLIKYDSKGNTVWTVVPSNYSNLGFYCQGSSVAVDNYGNTYVSGIFEDYLDYGSYAFSTAGYQEQFVIKFNSNGNPVWGQQSNGGSNYSYYYSNSITVDQSGAAYLTSSFYNNISFGADTFSNVDTTSSGFFIVKFNPGGSIAWGKQATLDVQDKSWASSTICSDDSNHIYLCGGMVDGLPGVAKFTFSGYTVSVLDTDSYDAPCFILKLDSSGNALCGTTLLSGGYSQGGNGVTVDSTGQFVYLGGTFYETFNIGNTTLTNPLGGENPFIGRWQACYNCTINATLNPSSSIICAGSTLNLTATGGSSYSWSPSMGLNTTNGSSVIANPTANVTYAVTIDAGACTATDYDTVVVIPAPNVPTISQHGDTLVSSANTNNQWYINGAPLNGDTSHFLIIPNPNAFYSVTVTNPANGCSSSSAQIEEGINQLAAISGQLSIFPNPTNGTITIDISSSVSDISDWNLRLNDVLGRTIYTRNSLSYTNEVDLSNLAGGVYFITVTNKTGEGVFKVVKQ